MSRGPSTKWTPEAVARLRQLAGTARLVDIAAQIGCSKSTAHRKMTALGISESTRLRWPRGAVLELQGMVRAGKTAQQIAAHFRCGLIAIYSQLSHRRLHTIRSVHTRPTPRLLKSYEAQAARIERMVALAAKISRLKKTRKAA